MKCLSCQSLKGDISLSPGPVVYEGEYWRVEHVYPTGILGWLVIVLKRHCEALHQLNHEELGELATVQELLATALHEETDCQKEYSVLYAEKENFNHIHFHIIAIPADLPVENRGAGIFKLLNVPEDDSVSRAEIIALCGRLMKRIGQ